MSIIILLRILSTILIPVFVKLYVDRSKESTTTPKWKRWILNPYLLCSLLSLGAMMSLEYCSSKEPELEELELNYISIENFKEELKSQKNNEIKEGTDLYKMILLKLQHADYSLRQKEFTESIKTLNELLNGKDQLGEFPKIDSYVIYNNIGIAHFHKHRNKNFFASNFLTKSIEKIKPINQDYKVVQINLTNLNSMVNKLD